MQSMICGFSRAYPIFNQCITSIPPEDIRKTFFGFLIFSGGIEVEHWLKMG